MSAYQCNPKGVPLFINSMYIGRHLVIPRRKEFIRYGNKLKRIEDIIWQYDSLAGEWEAVLVIDEDQ